MIKALRCFLAACASLLPLATLAHSQLLQCPDPSQIQVTVHQETYGNFIQWQKTEANIFYLNNNAHALIPLRLTSVRLLGQDVTCEYQAFQSKLSQVAVVTVGMSSFGDTALPAHFRSGTANPCPHQEGGVCCNPAQTFHDCSFYFDS